MKLTHFWDQIILWLSQLKEPRVKRCSDLLWKIGSPIWTNWSHETGGPILGGALKQLPSRGSVSLKAALRQRISADSVITSQRPPPPPPHHHHPPFEKFYSVTLKLFQNSTLLDCWEYFLFELCFISFYFPSFSVTLTSSSSERCWCRSTSTWCRSWRLRRWRPISCAPSWRTRTRRLRGWNPRS